MPKENQDGTEKSEHPTPRKIRKARQDGNVARSMEANSAAVLTAGIIALIFFGGWILTRMSTLMIWVFSNLGQIEVSKSGLPYYMKDGAVWMFKTLIPILASIAVMGIIINLLQTGVLWTVKPLQPRFSKLNPVSGAKKLFNQRAWVRLLTNLVKVMIIGYVAYRVILWSWPHFIPLMDSEIPVIFHFLAKTILRLLMWTLFALYIIAIVDFSYQKYKYTEDLKMTKQEVKDERKMMEGDPQVKGKIRQMQFQMAFNQMIKELPNADVVVTNPIHVAVALKYNADKMDAPVVVGKGLRLLAERIKKIAHENDIPIVENPPLARSLYKLCNVGEEIPGHFYQDVAEILAYIYQLRQGQPAT
ncbi:MAG: flagellar biosynthesis protein FlhB [bacterium]